LTINQTVFIILRLKLAHLKYLISLIKLIRFVISALQA